SSLFRSPTVNPDYFFIKRIDGDALSDSCFIIVSDKDKTFVVISVQNCLKRDTPRRLWTCRIEVSGAKHTTCQRSISFHNFDLNRKCSSHRIRRLSLAHNPAVVLFTGKGIDGNICGIAHPDNRPLPVAYPDLADPLSIGCSVGHYDRITHINDLSGIYKLT